METNKELKEKIYECLLNTPEEYTTVRHICNYIYESEPMRCQKLEVNKIMSSEFSDCTNKHNKYIYIVSECVKKIIL